MRVSVATHLDRNSLERGRSINGFFDKVWLIKVSAVRLMMLQ